MFIARMFFLIALLCVRLNANAGELLVEGDRSPVITGNLVLVREMNEFLVRVVGAEEPRVAVYFVEFQNEESAGYPLLSELQVLEKWDEKRRRDSKHFLGWTYTERYQGQRIVQMSPDLIRQYYTRDQYGMFTIPNSSLWYAIGHELVHAHLFAKGIPENDHHCYMVETGIVQKLIDYLSERKALAFSSFLIMQGEVKACQKQRYKNS